MSNTRNQLLASSTGLISLAGIVDGGTNTKRKGAGYAYIKPTGTKRAMRAARKRRNIHKHSSKR